MSITPPLTAVHNFWFTHSCWHSLLYMMPAVPHKYPEVQFLAQGHFHLPTVRQQPEIDPASRSSYWATAATVPRVLLRCQLSSHPLQWFRSFKPAADRHPDLQRWIPHEPLKLESQPQWLQTFEWRCFTTTDVGLSQMNEYCLEEKTGNWMLNNTRLQVCFKNAGAYNSIHLLSRNWDTSLHHCSRNCIKLLNRAHINST